MTFLVMIFAQGEDENQSVERKQVMEQKLNYSFKNAITEGKGEPCRGWDAKRKLQGLHLVRNGSYHFLTEEFRHF